MATWRILRGVHSDKDARLVHAVTPKENPGAFLRDRNGNLAKDDDGNPIFGRMRQSGENVLFYPGDVIETDKDLDSLQVGNAKRYELLPRFDMSQADKVDNLDSLTIPQLREMAEAEEIPLGDASKKSEIIEVIRLSQIQTETVGV